MSEAYAKPLPVPTPESQPFWDAVRRHELRLQRCQACGQFWFPPSNVCPECLSPAWAWELVSGRGTVFSFVVMHRAYHPGFKDALPYNVAVIELEEGPRLVSNVVDCRNEELYVGMPVEVAFDDVTDTVTLPKFRPRPGA
jgi:uncharacterized OB-fold protein